MDAATTAMYMQHLQDLVMRSNGAAVSNSMVGQAYTSPTLVDDFKQIMPSDADSDAKLIDYRGHRVAAFDINNQSMICLPQGYDLFLKNHVGGLHTVYTKLKRMGIQPPVCNVEQVRALRSLGAIAPGVNRCKLISRTDFDLLYEDCTTASARPGRPPKRSPPLFLGSADIIKKPRFDSPAVSEGMGSLLPFFNPLFMSRVFNPAFLPNTEAFNNHDHPTDLSTKPNDSMSVDPAAPEDNISNGNPLNLTTKYSRDTVDMVKEDAVDSNSSDSASPVNHIKQETNAGFKCDSVEQSGSCGNVEGLLVNMKVMIDAAIQIIRQQNAESQDAKRAAAKLEQLLVTHNRSYSKLKKKLLYEKRQKCTLEHELKLIKGKCVTGSDAHKFKTTHHS